MEKNDIKQNVTDQRHNIMKIQWVSPENKRNTIHYKNV